MIWTLSGPKDVFVAGMAFSVFRRWGLHGGS